MNLLHLFPFLLLTLPQRFTYAYLIYECTDFDPTTLDSSPCGHNTRPHQWLIHYTKTLPLIIENVVNMRYILYLDDRSPGRAEYQLNGPSSEALSHADSLCVQVAYLSSDDCQGSAGGSLCKGNITLKSHGTQVKPDKSFTFLDQGWNVVNYQFNLSSKSSPERSILKVLLWGEVNSPENPGPSSKALKPYLAVKFIQVKNDLCTERIGTRKEFWILVMVVFSLVTGYTFVHIAIKHAIFEHRKRFTHTRPTKKTAPVSLAIQFKA